MSRALPPRYVVWLLALSLAGCATSVPYVGEGPHPQITRGRPVPIVDFIGNILGIPSKLLLLNQKVANHAVSENTEGYLVQYINAPIGVTEGTHYSINEYAPVRALRRLVRNKKVAWPYRLLLGLPTTLLVDVLFPSRVFGGFFLIPSDYYNPFTDTVLMSSDLPSVVLHEAGHSHDFNKRRFKGTYALLRFLPPVTLFQEYKASKEAVGHLGAVGKVREACSAHEILQPAFGSYVGSYIPFPGTNYAGAAVGHVTGRITSHNCRKDLRAHERESPPPSASLPPTPPAAPSPTAP